MHDFRRFATGETSWMDDRNCRDTDPMDWFPHRGDLAPVHLCAECPVADDCLNYALDNAIPYGTWGGVSERRRRIYRRELRKRPGAVRVERHDGRVVYLTRNGEPHDAGRDPLEPTGYERSVG